MEIDMEDCLTVLKSSESFAMATILTKDGSAPRGPGAKMSVKRNGDISGTVGGGLEALAIEAALGVIREQEPKCIEFFLSKEDFRSINMICGGTVEILIEYVDACDGNNIAVFERI